MIFIHPEKGFLDSWGNEAEVLAKIQIDNSLELGWDPKDILMVTNFPWEYRGIKAIELGEKSYCEFSPTASKITAIIEMFNQGLIEDDLYWFHDLDAFQLEPITKEEIGDSDLSFTDYGITTINEGRNRRPSTGVLFFNNKSKDIFELIFWKAGQYKCNEEVALLELIKQNKMGIKDRIKVLNVTHNYATRRRDLVKSYLIADKPLKVIHFHPFDKRPVAQGIDNISACMYGKNGMNKILMTDSLINIFNKHGIC